MPQASLPPPALSISPLILSSSIDHKTLAVECAVSSRLKQIYGDNDTINKIIPDGNRMQFNLNQRMAGMFLHNCLLS